MSSSIVGTTVFKTASYGERLYRGPIRTYFRNEARLSGSMYRVVEVTMRGAPGEEEVLCEYVAPTEYPSLMQAITVAIDNRKEYLRTAAEENAYATDQVNATERAYMLGATTVGTNKAA